MLARAFPPTTYICSFFNFLPTTNPSVVEDDVSIFISKTRSDVSRTSSIYRMQIFSPGGDPCGAFDPHSIDFHKIRSVENLISLFYPGSPTPEATERSRTSCQ